MPAGRPTKYKPEYPDLAYKYCLLGATNERLARNFNVDVATIDKWLRDIQEFSSAVKAGREEADANVGKALYQRATGYVAKEQKVLVIDGEPTIIDIEKHYPPDTGAACMWLKNRAPEQWREKQEVVHHWSDTLRGMSDDELAREELAVKKALEQAMLDQKPRLNS